MASQRRDWNQDADDVRQVLMTEWDPIGCGVPDDEYDSYIPGVLRLLYNRADATAVADYLDRVETESIGLRARPEVNRRVAEMLCNLFD